MITLYQALMLMFSFTITLLGIISICHLDNKKVIPQALPSAWRSLSP